MNNEIRKILEEKVKQYELPSFIASDPIQIPKKFEKKEDIEISAFITATLAWGQRPMIIKKANQWMDMMNNEPFNFITNASDKELEMFSTIIYRTMNGDDSLFFVHSLRNIYINHGGLENIFSKNPTDIKLSIQHFRKIFLETPHLPRSEKHIANTEKESAAKRINMFLRWMVRSSEKGVDFGIWKKINPSALMIPLDVHSARTSRKMGLLTRTQNDWKAVEELTNNLRKLDALDPVKYDFALFGMGVFENKTKNII